MVGCQDLWMTKLSPRFGGIWGVGLGWCIKARFQLLAPGVLSHFATFSGLADGSRDYWNLRIGGMRFVYTVGYWSAVSIIGFT